MKRLKMVTALAVTVVAMTGLATSSATADVLLHDGSVELALEGHMDMTVPNEPWPEFGSCYVDLGMEIAEDGAIDVTSVDAYGDGFPDYNCLGSAAYPNTSEYLDDCDDAGGWTGQILGPGDEWDAPDPSGTDTPIEYAGIGDFEAVVIGCTNIFDLHTALRFAFDVDEYNESLEWTQPEHPMFLQFSSFPSGYAISGTGWGNPAEGMGIESVE